MQNVDSAKKRLLPNVVSNILVVIVNTLASIWLTRYLIKHLGLAVYGLIPLTVAIASYFNLLTQVISGAVGRFVAIHMGRDEIEESNVYFSTAFYLISALCGLVLPIAIATTIFLPKIFQVPAGYEVEAKWLFLLVTFFSLISAAYTPFLVSTFVRHRFDLINIVRIGSKFFQVAIIFFCFSWVSASIIYVGISYFGYALFILVFSVLLTRYLTPELYIRQRLFRWSAAREMGVMGTWVTINQMGGMLFSSVAIVVINLLLGSEQVALYAPFTQLVILIDLLSLTVSHVFYPVAYEYIAKDKTEELTRLTLRSMKFMALLMALPIGLLCGLGEPLFEWWLGPEFAALSPLLWILVGSRVITVTVRPIFAIQQGFNKVRTPSIVIVVVGLISLGFSVLLIKLGYGLYGVAFSTAFCRTGGFVLFVPVYSALLLGQKPTIFLKGILLGVLLIIGLFIPGWLVSRMYDLSTIPRLICVGLLLSILYCILCYLIFMNKKDRTFFWSLIHRK